MKNLSIFSFFFLIFIHHSFASDVTFTGGAGNSLWQESANWDTGSVPDATSNVIIPSGMTVNIFNGTMALAEEVLLSGYLIINGSLVIENGSEGIRTGSISAELEINGTLIVKQVDGPGVRINAELTVNSSGSITITDLTGTEAIGFSVRSGVNYGVITIDNVGANGMRMGNSEFVNHNIISINDALRDGLYNGASASGILTNEGTITITGSKWHSIHLARGSLVNNGTLTITQEENTTQALDPNTEMIRIVTSGSIYNHGIFNLEYLGDGNFGDIENDNILRNEECGEMYFTRISGTNGLEMTNLGFLFAGAEFRHLDNDGVLVSVLNSGIDNNGVVFFEEFNDYEVGVPVNGFMSGNTSIEFADELFVDEALTISAGQLFNNEIWLPSAAAGGKNVFYANVSTTGCSKVIEINLGNSVVTGTNTFLPINGLWSDDSNWSLGHIPLISEKCIVTDDTDTIIVDISTQIVDIEVEANMIIEEGKTLTISGAEEDGMNIINSELTNYGEIIIDKCGRSGLRGSLISTVSNSGSILVSKVKFRGIESDSIYNVGTISSDGSYKAGVRATKFYNDGDIDINNVNDPLSSGSSGIFIGGLETGWNFYNGVNGEIEISNVDEAFINCIIQQAGSNSTFNNAGKIIATGSSNYGWIINGATITNEETGFISLSDVRRGNIAVDNGDFSRLDDFYNYGHLKVFDSGLLFKTGSTSITDDYGGLIVKNGGHFINKSCGVLESDDYLELLTSGVFENEGTVISHNDYLNIVTATFTNKGTIVDYEGAWDGVFFFNEEYKLETITDELTVGSAFEIFDLGTLHSTIISHFYKDDQLTELVAIYDNETDMLTPLSEAEELTNLYYQALYSSSCRDTIQVKLDIPISGSSCKTQEWIGASNGAWSKAVNWSEGYVPGVCDNALIDNGSTVIVDVNTDISHIEILSGELKIDEDVVLSVYAGQDKGLYVEGNTSIINNGSLNIYSNKTGIELAGFVYDFRNYGSVNVITNDKGLIAKDEGAITNYGGGSISLYQNDVGGRALEINSPDTYLDNLGSIYISDFQDGIYLNSGGYILNNESILIENTNFAIQLYGNSALDNEADMEMYNIGVSGITLGGNSKLRNLNSSYIELETKRIGINNGANATVENSGWIEIGGKNELYGIASSGLITNNTTGTLNVSDFETYGILSTSSALLENEGTLKIKPSSTNGLHFFNAGTVKSLSGSMIIED